MLDLPTIVLGQLTLAHALPQRGFAALKGTLDFDNPVPAEGDSIEARAVFAADQDQWLHDQPRAGLIRGSSCRLKLCTPKHRLIDLRLHQAELLLPQLVRCG